MRRVWLFGFLVALAIAAGFLFLTERPLTVTVALAPERFPKANGRPGAAVLKGG